MTINPVIQFILDTLHDNEDVRLAVDNQFYVGLLRAPVSLTAPHYTRVGIEYVSDSGDNIFFTTIRDWDETKIQIKVTVVSSYGHNDAYCRNVVESICQLFMTNRKQETLTHKIFVDQISSSIVESEDARWTGTINLTVSYMVPVIEEA